MAFAKPLAKIGMFGLPGLALSGAFNKKDKKDKTIDGPRASSYVTENVDRPAPSLLNDTRY